MNEQEMEALLTTPVDGFAHTQGVTIRAAYWAHSGVVQPGRRSTIEVRKRAEVLCLLRGPTRTLTLARKPPGSNAVLEGGRFLPDVGGLYIVEIEIGGWVRSIELVAVPDAVLDRIGPRGSPSFDRLLVFRNITNDPDCTRDTIATSLEGSNPTGGLDGSLLGHDRGINLRNYGK